jgi:DNA-binding transcriptional MerR regulator
MLYLLRERAEMAQISSVEIPNRPLFKASEVCDLAKVQPYVLRSWEAEFKDLGVARSGSATRIKHLLLIEGLTLAGVRRKLDEETEPSLDLQPPEEPAMVAPAVKPAARIGAETRERIDGVRRGLQSLLDLLAVPVNAVAVGTESAAELPVTASLFEGDAAVPEAPTTETPKATRAAKEESTKSASPRRKRSA